MNKDLADAIKQNAYIKTRNIDYRGGFTILRVSELI